MKTVRRFAAGNVMTALSRLAVGDEGAAPLVPRRRTIATQPIAKGAPVLEHAQVVGYAADSSTSAAEATDNRFDLTIALNACPRFHAMQAALPGMGERGGGAIVDFAALASSIIVALTVSLASNESAFTAGRAHIIDGNWATG